LEIQSHKGLYKVHFKSLFDGLRDGLPANHHLIIDSQVAKLYAKELSQALSSPCVIQIDATEENKSLETLPQFVTQLINNGIRRNHTLVAVGGGIIQDITAFIAATLLRGVPWKFYPTTLLAQADSCIGSKSSINIGKFKNQLGTFTPPQEIVICTEVLKTLSDEDMRSGIGEMIKVHLIEKKEA
jgi:3-dehydroquinate synthase